MATTAGWVAVRLLVAALCVALLLTFAQLTVDGLLAYYAHIAPYRGAG